MRPRLLLNCAPISFGGALQASVSFIREAIRDADYDWYYILSHEARRNLRDFQSEPDEHRVLIVDASPARSAKTRKCIASFVDQVEPQAIFTFFGPAYQRFSQPHLMGVADGWVTHANRLSYSTLDGGFSRARMLAQCIYKGLWYRAADRWVTEAECARQGLSGRYRIGTERIAVVPNNCAQAYHDAAGTFEQGGAVGQQRQRIVTLSAYYPHKNLRIIPQVARALLDMGREGFCFQLSLDADGEGWLQLQAQAEQLGVQGYIETVGVVPLAKGRDFYRGAAVMFMPSLLETFSASYPEAMAMQVPIVTVDLDFARNICGDAALYYRPESAAEAAHKIAQLLDEPGCAEQLRSRGLEVLAGLPEPIQRYRMYRDQLLALVA